MNKYFTNHLISEYENKSEQWFSDNPIGFYSNRYNRILRIVRINDYPNHPDYYVVSTDSTLNLVIHKETGVEILSEPTPTFL